MTDPSKPTGPSRPGKADPLATAEALLRETPVRASDVARDAALSAAMAAFDQEHAQSSEKSSTTAQGLAGEARQRDDDRAVTRGAKALWSFIMTPISPSYRAALAGGASLAVLTLAVFSLPTLMTGPAPIAPPVDAERPAQSQVEQQATAETEAVVAELDDPADAAPPAPVQKALPQPAMAPGQSGQMANHGASQQRQAFGVQSLQQSAPVAQGLANRAVRMAPAEPIYQAYQEQGRDRFADAEDNRIQTVTDNPVSTFSVDVDTASYAFMRSSLNNGALPPKDSIRVEEWINYFDYSYGAGATSDAPFGVDVAVMPTPWTESGTEILRIGIEGYDLPADSIRPPANLVFLIDTSGSMHSPDKLPLLKNAFRLLVSELAPEDRVSIVAYAGHAGTVLEPTAASEKGRILAAIDALNPGGSTAGGEGLRQAYALARETLDADGLNRVILATDGDFNVGFSDTDTLKGFIERQRDTGISLSVLGFGRGNLNDALMQALAQNGNGNAAYIDTLAEAQKVLVEEVTANLFTIASDVKVQVEFNPALVSEYRLIGYETRALNREDFSNDKVDAGEIGAGHTVTALYEITPVGSSAERIGDLRYGSDRVASDDAAQSRSAPVSDGPDDEIAFVKVRAKLPGENESRLYETPVQAELRAGSVADADADTRFAAAVAGFAGILKGGTHTGNMTLDDVITLARGAKGNDSFGYRAEFIRLVGLAKSAQALPSNNR
jgi:Ca-activated chloride channel family protein